VTQEFLAERRFDTSDDTLCCSTELRKNMSAGNSSKNLRPTETRAYSERPLKRPIAHDETLRAPAITTAVTPAQAGGVRSTVLPRIENVDGTRRLVIEGRPRYEELRHLGAGGQALVTLAHDHDIDRTVAVKRLLPERRDDASVLRFAEEIRAVGRLEHPNVVPIHDVGVDEHGQYFFVMKHIEGETLESIIARLRAGDEDYLRRYTFEYRLQICYEVLRGVEHAHALGILHRDLKPGNVMVGPLGEVVVMDWGLAKLSGDTGSALSVRAPASAVAERARLFETHAGALLGTPAYMAPEQAAGRIEALDVRSDIYSLAVMFYEFLSLLHPRRHCSTVAEMISEVVQTPIEKGPAISDFLRAGVPAALAHFVRHGLHHDPALRYSSVAAMRQRLAAVRDGMAPVECYLTLTQRTLAAASRGANRHPTALLAILVTTAVGLVAGLGTLAWALMH